MFDSSTDLNRRHNLTPMFDSSADLSRRNARNLLDLETNKVTQQVTQFGEQAARRKRELDAITPQRARDSARAPRRSAVDRIGATRD